MFRNAVNGPPPTLPSNTPLSGRTCIVTGANRGIGFECAKHLAALGASRVVLAVRDTAAGEKAKESILATLENRDSVRVEVRKLDLASFASVRAFVDEWSKQTSEADRNVHLLVENAGIQPGSSLKTEDGYELVRLWLPLGTRLALYLLIQSRRVYPEHSDPANEPPFALSPHLAPLVLHAFILSNRHCWISNASLWPNNGGGHQSRLGLTELGPSEMVQQCGLL